MRINKYLAQATGMSRRSADQALILGNVHVNGMVPSPGYTVVPNDTVTLNGKPVVPRQTVTLMLNKPVGYVVSRDGQGSKTIYDLLPTKYHQLKAVGRLDKNSSGLLLLTNDGDLTQQLTHPSNKKQKIYQISLDAPLQPLHQQMISDYGIELEDGPSKLHLEKANEDRKDWTITMHEGRNRQIRRTFAALGYEVTALHRTQFGIYKISTLESGKITII